MFDIVFADGSKCFCTRKYLKQPPLRDEKEENLNHEEEEVVSSEVRDYEEQDENAEENIESLIISSEEDENEEEEVKLMKKMGLPTSFSSKSKMGSRKYTKEQRISKKSKTSNVENAEAVISSTHEAEEVPYEEADYRSERERRISKKSKTSNIENAEAVISSTHEAEEVPYEEADHRSEREIYWQENKLWTDIDESISPDFKDYWERYGENILLGNWTKRYFSDNPAISAIIDDIVPHDAFHNNYFNEEVNNKCTNLMSEVTNCDLPPNDLCLQVLSDNLDSVCHAINDTCSPITPQQMMSNKNQIMNDEVNNREVASICSEDKSSFDNAINHNVVLNDENAIQTWDRKQWKNAWYTHVEDEINKLYESFKKHCYTYVGIFEEDSTTSSNGIIYKLEELRDLRFVISKPHPVSIRRRGHSFFPFIKWWKQQVERGYDLWETSIAESLCYKEGESIKEVRSESIDKKETLDISSNISLEMTETCEKETVANSTSNEIANCGDVDDDIKKYYAQRHLLFSLFHKGIKLDKESWYSVTPEKIAEHIAERCRCDVIIDAFCGAGGNTIQFAFTCNHVIAVDLDPVKLELAKHNAKIYGVEDRIDFICANFMDIGPSLKGDVIFLSPPWGGPEYRKTEGYDVASIQPDIYKLFEICQAITKYIAIYMPRSTYVNQLASLLDSDYVEVEQNVLNGKIKAITTYFGSVFSDEYYEDEDY